MYHYHLDLSPNYVQNGIVSEIKAWTWRKWASPTPSYTLTGEKCHLWHKTPHSQLQRRHQDPIAGCGWDQPYRNPTSRCRSRSSGRCYPGLQIQCNCHDLVGLEFQTEWTTEHLEVPRNVVTLHLAIHATHATRATTSQLVWTKSLSSQKYEHTFFCHEKVRRL